MNKTSCDSESAKKLSSDDLAVDRTQLAKYRTQVAADRTLMAWIRTSLSLIGFGFGIPTIVKTIENLNPYHPIINPIRFSVLIGLSFIATGVLGMVLGLKEHRKLLRQIKSDRYVYQISRSAEIVAAALLLIGLVAFVGVVVKALKS